MPPFGCCPPCLAGLHGDDCAGRENCACLECWPDTTPTPDAGATPPQHQDDGDDVDR
jgi:hypothetical protein